MNKKQSSITDKWDLETRGEWRQFGKMAEGDDGGD